MKCLETLCNVDDFIQEVFSLTQFKPLTCGYFIVPFLLLFLIPHIKSISLTRLTSHGDFTKRSTS